jgi:glycosyltransferase involved in cell wall biosynthesis
MHIVHLMASPFIGGPERQVLGLARHLPAGYRTSFLSFAEHGLARPFLADASHQGYDAVELQHNAPYIGACIQEVTRELVTRGADILCTSGYKPDVIGWRAGRRAGIPVVSIAHGWTGATFKVWANELIDRLVLRFVDAIVCVSRAQARRVRRAFVPQDKIVVIPNAIDADAFGVDDPGARATLLQMFPTAPRWVVGAAGRLSPEKNFALFVEAAAHVASEYPDAGFVIFGDGPLRTALTRQVDHLAIQDRFLLAGFRPDFARFLPHFDVAILSSTTEGLPVILLEACAAGVPVVATAVGGIPEVIEDGRTGYLVPSQSAAALADRIIALLRDEPRRQAMGHHAQEHVRKHFTFEQQARQYAALFTRLQRGNARKL